MMSWPHRILCSHMAWHAFSIMILMTRHCALAQDMPESVDADKRRDTEALQSELPNPEFSPHGPFLGPLEIDHIARFGKLPRRMFLEPHLIPPMPVRTLGTGYVPLFDKTLREIDDVELLETAAISLARVAQEKLQDISGSADILIRHAESHSNLRVRFACARALVNGDVHESAGALLELDKSALDSQRQWIDTALASWKTAAAAEVWRERLAAESGTTAAVSSACDGLAALGDTQALEELRQLLHGELLSYPKRRAAAQAICRLAPDTGIAESELFIHGNVRDRLLVIELVSSDSNEAHARLLHLCADDSDGVASAAWGTLFRLNPNAIVTALPTGRSHNDAFIRMTAARAIRLFPDAERAGWLHKLMSDRHLEVRNVAREMLFLVAEENAPLKDGIIAITSDTLTANSENWEGIEQSLLLLGQFRAGQFAKRCVPLLEHPRSEVMVTSAWLLHLFPDPDPDVEQAVRKCLLRNEEMLKKPAVVTAATEIGEQSSYLIQYAGLMRWKDMQPLMEPHFSKTVPGGTFKRAAAMWTLGLFHENDPVPDLARSFLERLADRAGVPPEMDEVRRTSAIALGLMQAKSAVGGLLEAYQTDPAASVIPDSARWSLGMTGEQLPDPVKPQSTVVGGWKLNPVDD